LFSFIFQPFRDPLASPEQLGSPAGDSQGGGQPSGGGSRPHRCVPALWAGAQRATGVGGTLPPRLAPEGKRERGDSNSLLPQAISAALKPPPAGSSGPSLSSYPECSSIVGGTFQHRHSIRPQDLQPARTSLRPAVIGVPSHPEIWNWFSLASIRSVSAVSPRPCRKRSRFSMRAAIFSSTWVFINAFALMLGPVPRRSLRKLGIQFSVWLDSCSMIRPATAVPPQRPSCTPIPIPTRPASSRHHRLPASIRKRLERFTAHPQHMQQHRQFPGHRHHRALLQLLVLAIPRQVRSPPPDRAIDPLGP
jgi:hypothetical protein